MFKDKEKQGEYQRDQMRRRRLGLKSKSEHEAIISESEAMIPEPEAMIPEPEAIIPELEAIIPLN